MQLMHALISTRSQISAKHPTAELRYAINQALALMVYVISSQAMHSAIRVAGGGEG